MRAWLMAHTYPTKISLWPILWALSLLVLLALADQSLHRLAVYLVPPFAATLSILLYLPQQAVAQPLPVVAGSTLGAASGTLLALAVHGPMAAALIAGLLLWGLPRLGIYHPPAIALSMYPLLLHPGHWFPVIVVLPFTLVAVFSHSLLSSAVPSWIRYPRQTVSKPENPPVD